MVYRLFVEKKRGLNNEARALLSDLRTLMGLSALTDIRIINRYDVENISRELFEHAVATVFSEPQLDVISEEFEAPDAHVFAVTYLPGQFDQRADSAAQCLQIISRGERPPVNTAKVYALYGELTDSEIAAVKRYVINPVEACETSLEPVETLKMEYAKPMPVEVLTGFTSLDDAGLSSFIKARGLAMDLNDVRLCRDYFISENREPTITEIRILDTYWSDHCRHTTFLTLIDNVEFAEGAEAAKAAYAEYQNARRVLDRAKPECLMDIATLAMKLLRSQGELEKLDESEEINACTVKITIDVNDEPEDWLLLFKNETHNHPTEIEPFGGAATCIGGAIRDPLSGRAYVYGAMRLSGCGDPLTPINETLPGKLPQRKLAPTAAAGYSSYGNQIGLATGIVDEIYHEGYTAKHMEIGAVIAAAPAKNVRRERPEPNDIVILLGGKTGRDGCGGATGSSKSHDVKSLETCGAEVQKGNAPEERKLQRLFRNADAALLIKRCNDFGAGGVSVAIGELADGLSIDLSAVPKKYEGLDGTELAISESQERMAVVVAPDDVEKFLSLADAENLEATVVARVTAEPRMKMRLNGEVIADISREFLSSNGAQRHASAYVKAPEAYDRRVTGGFAENYARLAGDLNACSRRGLSERFDSTIGSGGVLMPFGGERQLTPVQAMAMKLPVESGDTRACSFMAWGFDPFISEKSPYHGAYLAVVSSISKLIATGAEFKDVYLTLQEYFPKPMNDKNRWGMPMSALLGAFKAQLDLGVAAIGGKDSMSGSFEKMDVPPTLVSFAVTTDNTDRVLGNEFKSAGHNVVILRPKLDKDGLPAPDSLKRIFSQVSALIAEKRAVSAYTPCYGGISEAVMKMCLGNNIGFEFVDNADLNDIFGYNYGCFILELVGDEIYGELLGKTVTDPEIWLNDESVSLEALLEAYENKLESVYPCYVPEPETLVEAYSYEAKRYPAPAVKHAKPRVLIPVFPGTNCEYDSARAVNAAGSIAEQFVINNLSPEGIARSAELFAERLSASQMLFIPGGFSAGDEPDGSGKFITAFMRNPAIAEQLMRLINKRDGLVLGICNGFQALIKLGLLPFGEIREPNASYPTLTYNAIDRHQSRLVRVRVASNKSPWLKNTRVGEVYTLPISHGEGRFLADENALNALAQNGQIATQYVDISGVPSMRISVNPNGSAGAVEGITSPDGRVFGRMAHAERIGRGLYKNVIGEYDMRMFEAATEYFS